MGINIHLWLIDAKFEQMENYLELCSSAFVQKSDEIVKSYNEYIKNLDPSVEEIDHDQFTDELIEVEKVLPKQLFSSFVVFWFAFIEQELLDFCEKCKLKIEFSAKEKIKLDKGIDRAKTFLFRSANYQIEQEDWQKLDQIRNFRNFLVHEGTEIDCSYYPIENSKNCKLIEKDGVPLYFEMNTELYNYLHKNEMIEIIGITLLIIPTMNFCKELIDFGKRIFKNLYTSDFYLHQ